MSAQVVDIRKVAPFFFLSLPLQRFAVVVVVGAGAGEVMTHFHIQTRIPPAHLVTAALTFSHGHRGKWLCSWSRQCQARPRSVPRCTRQDALAEPAGSPPAYPRDAVDQACPQTAARCTLLSWEARPSFIKVDEGLTTKLCEFGFCRDFRGSSFTIGDEEYASRLCEFGVSRKPKRPSFTIVDGELSGALCDFGFCGSL